MNWTLDLRVISSLLYSWATRQKWCGGVTPLCSLPTPHYSASQHQILSSVCARRGPPIIQGHDYFEMPESRGIALLVKSINWCLWTGLNRWHADFQSAALPTELHRHKVLALSASTDWRFNYYSSALSSTNSLFWRYTAQPQLNRLWSLDCGKPSCIAVTTRRQCIIKVMVNRVRLELT